MSKDTHPGIVGLRAAAVLSIVLFHFIPRAMPGGFIGVDIFFVISGFLISRSIYSKIAEKQFSFNEFYERRARRIVPAFAVTSLVTLSAAYFVLMPLALKDAANSLLAAVAFSANIYFYATSDYFSPTAEQMPFLHLWSLGVEEQFYMLFPVLIVLLTKWRAKFLPATLVALLVASLISSEVTLRSSPTASFYLPWNRAFELLIGAVLALPSVRLAGKRLGRIATLLGITILAVSLWLIEPETPFPGMVALIPCLGVTLVIWGAHQPNHFLARTLAARPVRFFSDISYSLYLVHWPIVVFGHIMLPDSFAIGFVGTGLALAVAFATFSYYFVEQPVRHNRQLFTTRIVFVGSAASFVCICAVAILVIANNGFPGRLTARANTMLASLQYDPKPAFQTEVCFMEPHQDVSDFDVGTCIPQVRPLAVLWGDSHLAQFLHGLEPLLSQEGYGVGQFGSSGCAPALDVDAAMRPKCRAFNDFAISEILNLKPDIVLLGAIWIGTSEQLEGLGRSIRALRKAGIKVVVFGNAPLYKEPVPTILANRLLAGNDDIMSGSELEADFVIKNNAAVRDYVDQFEGVKFVSVLALVCPNGSCPLASSGRPLHFDIAHLTDTGSDFFASRLFPEIEPLL